MGSTKIFSSFKRENIRAQSQSKAKVNLQLSNVWDPTHNLLGSSKGLGHFSSHALCSNMSSSRLQMPVLHGCCCSWWSFMVLASPKHCMTPSVLGRQLQMRLDFHQWPSMASHSAEPQLLFMTPSCLQNQYHLGDPYTLPSPAAAGVQPWLSLEHSLFVLSENTSQKMSPQ